MLLHDIILQFSYQCSPHRSYLHSFPTRRSSDLGRTSEKLSFGRTALRDCHAARGGFDRGSAGGSRHASGRADQGDRKSTRLNSSHVATSYAVFCLKKKKSHSRCIAFHKRCVNLL